MVTGATKQAEGKKVLGRGFCVNGAVRDRYDDARQSKSCKHFIEFSVCARHCYLQTQARLSLS